MKHLKLYESFREEDIHTICREYRIKNYTINEDGSIDVNGNVNLAGAGKLPLTKLPLKFRNISGYFLCQYNQLASLEGGPEAVGGGFHCSNNQLKSLIGGPKSVGGDFSCNDNQLVSLEGCPESVGKNFYCSVNKLTSLEGGPESVGKNFYCSVNKLTSLEGGPKSVGGNFCCHYNEIITFEHLPYSIGDYFDCRSNPIYEIWRLFQDYDKIEFLNDCDAIREPDNNSDKPIIILDRLNEFLEQIGKKPVTNVWGYKCI